MSETRSLVPGPTRSSQFRRPTDVAAVAAAAFTENGHAGKGYALAGPQALTLADVAEQISWTVGRRIKYVETDRVPIRDALLAAGAPAEVAELNSQIYTQAFSSSMFGVLNDDVLSATGRPPVSFGEFAAEASAAWRR